MSLTVSVGGAALPKDASIGKEGSVSTLKTSSVGWRALQFLGNCLYYGLVVPWLLHKLYKWFTPPPEISNSPQLVIPPGGAQQASSPEICHSPRLAVPECSECPSSPEVFHAPRLVIDRGGFSSAVCQRLAAQLREGDIEQAITGAVPVIRELQEKEPKKGLVFEGLVWNEFRTSSERGLASQLIAQKIPCRTVYQFMKRLAEAADLKEYEQYYAIAIDIRLAMDEFLDSVKPVSRIEGWKTMSCLTFRQDLLQIDFPQFLLSEFSAACPIHLHQKKDQFDALERSFTEIYERAKPFLLQYAPQKERWSDDDPPVSDVDRARDYFEGECIGMRITDYFLERRALVNNKDEQLELAQLRALDTESMRFNLTLYKFIQFGKNIHEIRRKRQEVTDEELERSIGSFEWGSSDVPSSEKILERVELFRKFKPQVDEIQNRYHLHLNSIWKAIKALSNNQEASSIEIIAEITKEIRISELGH